MPVSSSSSGGIGVNGPFVNGNMHPKAPNGNVSRPHTPFDNSLDKEIRKFTNNTTSSKGVSYGKLSTSPLNGRDSNLLPLSVNDVLKAKRKESVEISAEDLGFGWMKSD